MLKRHIPILCLAPDAAAGGGAAVAEAPAAGAVAPPPADNPADAPEGESDDAYAKAMSDEINQPPKDKLPDKAADAPKDKADSKPADKADAKDKPADKPADKPDTTPAGLRKEKDRLKGELSSLQERLAAQDAKIAEYDKKGKETESLIARQRELEAEITKRDSELRAIKQEASPEFKAKYDVPFNRLAEKAQNVVQRIVIPAGDDPTIEPQRNATWGEFQKLYALDEATAEATADQMFGVAGARVAMRYYYDLHRMQDERATALEEERANAKQRQESEEAAQATKNQQIIDTFKKVSHDLAESNQDYRDDPEDKELSGARHKGYSLVDAVPKSIDQQIIHQAHVRHCAAAFWPQRMLISRQSQEIATLKSEIEKLKAVPGGKSIPPGGGGNGDGELTEEQWADEVRKHVAE